MHVTRSPDARISGLNVRCGAFRGTLVFLGDSPLLWALRNMNACRIATCVSSRDTETWLAREGGFWGNYPVFLVAGPGSRSCFSLSLLWVLHVAFYSTARTFGVKLNDMSPKCNVRACGCNHGSDTSLAPKYASRGLPLPYSSPGKRKNSSSIAPLSLIYLPHAILHAKPRVYSDQDHTYEDESHALIIIDRNPRL